MKFHTETLKKRIARVARSIGWACVRLGARLDPVDDDDDNCTCESCSARHPIEDMTPTVDGCHLCPNCWADALEIFKACQHKWTATFDEWGEPAHVCERCSFTVTDVDFPSLFGTPAPERPAASAEAA